MKQTNGYGKAPHSIWETNQLNLYERAMISFIIERANRFGKEDKEFNLTDNDFVNIGFGKDKVVLRKTRQTLIDLNLINYKEGHTGKGSAYSINWDKIVNLPIVAEYKPVTEAKDEQEIEMPAPLQMPQMTERIKEIVKYNKDKIDDIVQDIKNRDKYNSKAYEEQALEKLNEVIRRECRSQDEADMISDYVNYMYKKENEIF